MNETKFDGKGEIYAQFRPSYPQTCIDALFAHLHWTQDDVLADIGAGTGKLTQLLLEKGCTVYAVEPNSDMRRIAEEKLSALPKFLSVNGTAEHTALPPESVHGITAAQAFHWFDRTAFRKECQRILKPGGSVVLIWNSRDESSALVQENDRINRLYRNGAYQTLQFDFPLYFDMQGFVGRNLSASYAPKPTDAAYNDYVAALQAVFGKYAENNRLCMPNFTQCYLGQVYFKGQMRLPLAAFRFASVFSTCIHKTFTKNPAKKFKIFCIFSFHLFVFLL